MGRQYAMKIDKLNRRQDPRGGTVKQEYKARALSSAVPLQALAKPSTARALYSSACLVVKHSRFNWLACGTCGTRLLGRGDCCSGAPAVQTEALRTVQALLHPTRASGPCTKWPTHPACLRGSSCKHALARLESAGKPEFCRLRHRPGAKGRCRGLIARRSCSTGKRRVA